MIVAVPDSPTSIHIPYAPKFIRKLNMLNLSSMPNLRHSLAPMLVLGLNPNFGGMYFSASLVPIISRNIAPIMAKW